METGLAAPSGWRRLLARLGVDVRRGEGAVAGLLFLSFFLVVTFQYVVKTVRQSTFIDSLGATRLPWVYLLVAICSYPLLRVYVRFADRVPRHRLIAATCGVVMASMAGFWWLYRFGWAWVPMVFYVWVSIAFVTTVSQFWAFCQHALDPRQAKRLFGLIGAGGLLGGIAGGQVARLTTEWIGTRFALLLAAVMLGGVIVAIHRVHRLSGSDEPSQAGATGLGKLTTAGGGFEIVRRSRHLRMVALVLVLGVAVAQIVDLQFNWAVEQATTDLGQRTAWFGNFFSLVGVAAFAFQLLFTSRIHRRLGVGFAMRVLPVTLGIGTIALIATAGLAPEALIGAALALKVGESGIRYSLDQSTRELLFFPVPSAVRVKAKAFIDVFAQRSAKGLAALLLLPVAFGVLTPVQASWASLGLIVLWLAAIAAAYRAYVESFRAGLKDRTVDAAVPINLSDLRTAELVIRSLGSPDPRQVLHGLDILESNDRGNLVPPLLLYHDDAEVRRRTLRILGNVGRRDASHLVEGRLRDADPDVRAEAIRVFTEFHRGEASRLMLPRLQESDPRVRAAAVACLVEHGDEHSVQRARRTLLDMLSDADPDHRAEAVRAIGAVRGGEFEDQLVRALDDHDARVAREAIRTVRRVVARDGFNPLFLPRIVSMLQNRRLKHDAREALVAFGEPSVPILAYFMNDSGESLFVRRALPRVLAGIGGEATLRALIDALPGTDDGALRAQIVEALAARGSEIVASGARPAIERAIRAEAECYLERLRDLRALAGNGLAFDGLKVRGDLREGSLLLQMLAERLDDHLRTLFGLLAVLLPARDVWAAHRSLLDGGASRRTHALEYLDNTLAGEVRQDVFAVIDDRPVADKLRDATKTFGLRAADRDTSLRALLDTDGRGDAAFLSIAALYTIYTDRLASLYPSVRELAGRAGDEWLRETAAWVVRRLDTSTPSPPGG